MPTPSVYWSVMSNYPPQIRANQQSPEVTAHLKIFWADAFTFVNQVMGEYTTLPSGIVVSGDPWRYPGNDKLVAVECEVEPFGVDQNFINPGKHLGLVAGEYWQYAKATVKFATPPWMTSLDDPQGRMQLDPDDPITWCVQDLDIGSEYVPSNIKYIWKSDSKPVNQPIPRKISTTEIDLKFPRVAYIPAKKIEEHVDCVNSQSIFGKPEGTVVFLGAKTSQSATSQGIRDKSVTLKFKFSTFEWNKLERENGVIDQPINPTGGGGIYRAKDLKGLFR